MKVLDGKEMGVALPGPEPTSLWLGAHCDYTLSVSFFGSVYNAGPERDSICRAWGQHHVETFDGLYYYFSGKGSYTLVASHEPEGQTFSVQVRPPLTCRSREAPLVPLLSQVQSGHEAALKAMPWTGWRTWPVLPSRPQGVTHEFIVTVSFHDVYVIIT